jgi:LysM repeat protein
MADIDAVLPDPPACPFVGLVADPATHFSFPHEGHRCRATRLSSTIDLAHQARYCLAADFERCERYLARTRRPTAEAAAGRAVAILPGGPHPIEPLPPSAPIAEVQRTGQPGAARPPSSAEVPATVSSVLRDGSVPQAERPPVRSAPEGPRSGMTPKTAASGPSGVPGASGASGLGVSPDRGLPDRGLPDRGLPTDTLPGREPRAGTRPPLSSWTLYPPEPTTPGPVRARTPSTWRQLSSDAAGEPAAGNGVVDRREPAAAVRVLRAVAILVVILLVLGVAAYLVAGSRLGLGANGLPRSSPAALAAPAASATPVAAAASVSAAAASFSTASIAPTPSAPPMSPAPSTSPAPSRTPRTTSTIHIVRSGETLQGIATEYGVTVEQIVAANKLKNANVIVAGERLVIPAPSKAP